MSDYNETSKKLVEVAKKINESFSPTIIEMKNTLRLFSQRMSEVITPMISQMSSTEYMKPLLEEFKRFAEQIEKAKATPDSVFNYYRYSSKLNDFHWTWPYDMDSKSMLGAIETIESEEDFDDWLLEYFDETKTDALLHEITLGIPSKYEDAFSQIEIGIKNNTYILVNNTLLSIIDGILSQYVVNKKIIRRRKLLEPIIEFYDDNYSLENIPFIFELRMLNDNINFIFEVVDFNKDIMVETNKKIRRHSSVHGMEFSNNYIDTLFLLNALFWLIELKEILAPFENSLKEKDGKIYIKKDCLEKIKIKVSNYLQPDKEIADDQL